MRPWLRGERQCNVVLPEVKYGSCPSCWKCRDQKDSLLCFECEMSPRDLRIGGLGCQLMDFGEVIGSWELWLHERINPLGGNGNARKWCPVRISRSPRAFLDGCVLALPFCLESFFLFPGCHEVRNMLHRMIDFLPHQGQINSGAKWRWTETSEIVSQNKCFLLEVVFQ
jgi:hypothetical protein